MNSAAHGWHRAWPLLLLAALACVALPLLHAGFHSDDWIWLAIVRHLDHPFAPFVDGILHEYFYRPSSVALWWLAERLAGHASAGHYAVDIAVHAASCLLLVWLLRVYRVGLLPALLAGALFALAPAAMGTVSWLSNRNELLAVAAGFGFLLVLELALQRRAWLLPMTLLLALSVSSKETGLVFAAAGLLRLLWARRDGTTLTAWAWIGVLAPVAGLFVMRKLTLWPVGVAIAPSTAPAGIAGWWQTLPSALGGFSTSSLLNGLIAGALVVLALLALRTARAQPRRRLPLAIAGTLLLLPPLLQWPITHLVFADAGARLFFENLRFFYLATAALAMALAVVIDQCPRRYRMLASLVAVLAVLLPAGWASQRMTVDWARHSGPTSSLILELVRPLADADYPRGCVIVLAREHWPTAFPTFADAIVKYAAAPGASVLGCAVFTDTAPAHTLLPRQDCSAAHWPALALRTQQEVPVLRPLGNLCLAGFRTPDAAALDGAFHINLDQPVLPP